MKAKRLLVFLFTMIGVQEVNAQELMIEAENANSIVSAMKVYSKTSSSGGRYLATNSSNSGSAKYSVSVPAPGKYRLSARVKSPSTSKDSFYVSVNGGTKMTWHLPVLTSYGWANFSADLNLLAGANQLVIHGREAYTELDVIKLSPVGSSQPPSPAPVVGSPSPTPTPAATPSPTPIPTATPVVDLGALDPLAAPGRNFDLSLWKLTLPVDSAGSYSGTAFEIKPLARDYEHNDFFYTGSDGGMIFLAPVEGATTSGSKYARSELREMTSSYTNAAWTVEQGGTLSATLAVNQVPTTTSGTAGRIIIGQIHGPADELCRLYFDNGVLYFHDDKSGANQTEIRYILKSASGATSKIGLNEKFDYKIVATRQSLTVSAVHNGVTYSVSEPISAFWPGKGLYFKAGAYLAVGDVDSDAGVKGSGLGKATFYRLPPPSHP